MFSLRVLKKAKIDTKVATNAVEAIQALLDKFKLEPFTVHMGRALAKSNARTPLEPNHQPTPSNCYIYERNRIELSLRRFLFAASVDPLNWWVPRARLAGSTIITKAAHQIVTPDEAITNSWSYQKRLRPTRH